MKVNGVIDLGTNTATWLAQLVAAHSTEWAKRALLKLVLVVHNTSTRYELPIFNLAKPNLKSCFLVCMYVPAGNRSDQNNRPQLFKGWIALFQGINHYPWDKYYQNLLSYPVDSGLTNG